jgi:hypothetical protein
MSIYKYKDHLSDLQMYIEQLYTNKKERDIRKELSLKLRFIDRHNLLDTSQYIQLESVCSDFVHNPSEDTYNNCINFINELLGIICYRKEYFLDDIY